MMSLICKNTCDRCDKRVENKLFYHVVERRHVYVIRRGSQSESRKFDSAIDPGAKMTTS